jgi:hypothetical protein
MNADSRPTSKKIAFTCWSNDPQRINVPGQCGILRGRLFSTEKLARDFYQPGEQCDRGDVIVRVTVEAIGNV